MGVHFDVLPLPTSLTSWDYSAEIIKKIVVMIGTCSSFLLGRFEKIYNNTFPAVLFWNLKILSECPSVTVELPISRRCPIALYTIPVQCFLLKNQTVIDLTNTNAKRSYLDPCYFTPVFNRPIDRYIIDDIRSQQGYNWT